jgi:deoxycytidine triphosphate deaminase
VIFTDREIKIYVRRRLITIDPEPDEDIAYKSTAVDLRLDPTISIFKKLPSTAGVRQLTEIDPGDPNFKTDNVIKPLTDNVEIDQALGYALQPETLILG